MKIDDREVRDGDALEMRLSDGRWVGVTYRAPRGRQPAELEPDVFALRVLTAGAQLNAEERDFVMRPGRLIFKMLDSSTEGLRWPKSKA